MKYSLRFLACLPFVVCIIATMYVAYFYLNFGYLPGLDAEPHPSEINLNVYRVTVLILGFNFVNLPFFIVFILLLFCFKKKSNIMNNILYVYLFLVGWCVLFLLYHYNVYAWILG